VSDIELPSSRISSLWRYPVKSLRGEACDELELSPTGVVGDRQWGILDIASNTVLSAKREGQLFDAMATLRDGVLRVTLPGEHSYESGDPLDEALTTWLGRPVRLVEAATFGAAAYEAHADFEDDNSHLETWEGPAGSFVDSSPLHLLSSSDLEQLSGERPDLQWDIRRFRPNVFLSTNEESPSTFRIGARVAIGAGEIRIQQPCIRCVMTTRPQPGGVERQLDVLRHLARQHDSAVGVLAGVERPAKVRVGDLVRALT
jgi:uncharacterized protein YcbX